jgi:hypothetical protein
MNHPKRRNKIDGQFNARTIKMMESPAYRALSLSAHRVMDRSPRLKRRRSGFCGPLGICCSVAGLF